MSLKETISSRLHTEEDVERAAQAAIEVNTARDAKAQALRIGELASSSSIQNGVLRPEAAQRIQSEAFAKQPEVLGTPATSTHVEVQQVSQEEPVHVTVAPH